MKDTNYFKTQLEKELALVEKELNTVGKRNPSNPNDWEPKADTMDVSEADPNEVADKLESFEGNVAILKQLEIRLAEIKKALVKIEKGNFGLCGVCNGKIEEDRLTANPAAETCKAHMAK